MRRQQNWNRIVFVCICSAGFLSGCISAPTTPFNSKEYTPPAVESFPTQPSKVEGWETVVIGDGIQFDVPPALEKQESQGIDSIVGLYRSKEMELSFDYGWYSNSLEDQQYSDYKVVWVEIDKIEAKVATFYYPTSSNQFKYVAAVHFPDTGTSYVPHAINRLTIMVWCNTPEQQAIAEKIFQTVQFPH